MHYRKTAIILACCAAATGCVLVVHPEEGSETAWDDEWERDGRHYEERAYAPRSAGAGIAERVARSYGDDELLRDADVRVTARDGTVSLHGRVPDKTHFDRAVELALATEGVERVESRLTVEISNNGEESLP